MTSSKTKKNQPKEDRAGSFPGRRASKCKGPEVSTHAAGLRHSKKVMGKMPGAALSEGAHVVPGGSGGLGPWATNRQLRIRSGPGSFSCNGICSMGFSLEHQIKFTSGLGVNGGCETSVCSLPECPEAWGPKGCHCPQPWSLGMAMPKPVQDSAEERWEKGAVNDFVSTWAITHILQMGKSRPREVKSLA